MVSRQRGKKTAIGGSTDEHGCLTAAGYSWDASAEQCRRPWEPKVPTIQAPSEAVGQRDRLWACVSRRSYAVLLTVSAISVIVVYASLSKRNFSRFENLGSFRTPFLIP